MHQLRFVEFLVTELVYTQVVSTTRSLKNLSAESLRKVEALQAVFNEQKVDVKLKYDKSDGLKAYGIMGEQANRLLLSAEKICACDDNPKTLLVWQEFRRIYRYLVDSDTSYGITDDETLVKVRHETDFIN